MNYNGHATAHSLKGKVFYCQGCRDVHTSGDNAELIFINIRLLNTHIEVVTVLYEQRVLFGLF
jgi:hypothetical protein